MVEEDNQMIKYPSWKKLVNIKTGSIANGAIFRSPATYPYEEWVDFMLIDEADSPSGYAIIVASGFKAGLTLVHLPVEANSPGGGRGISVKWLIDNWNRWIYESAPEKVYFRRRSMISSKWAARHSG